MEEWKGNIGITRNVETTEVSGWQVFAIAG